MPNEIGQFCRLPFFHSRGPTSSFASDIFKFNEVWLGSISDRQMISESWFDIVTRVKSGNRLDI